MSANTFLAREEAQVNPLGAVTAIMALILGAAIMVIGVVLLQGMTDANPMVTYNETTHTGDRLQPASAIVVDDAEAAFGLTGTLLIVIIGVTILATLMGVLFFFK